MKILKKILIVLAVLVVLILIVAIFLPSSYKVERSVNIKSTSDLVASNISDLKKWNNWTPWKETDTAAIYTYNDTIGIGAEMSWKGEKMGSGKLRITSVDANDIQYDLNFFEPFNSSSKGTFLFAQSDSGLYTTWVDEGKLAYPVGRIMGFIMNFDKMMGPDFEKGLKKLKEISETSSTKYVIKEKNIESFTIALIHNKVALSEIGQTIGASFGKIQEYLKKNGAKLNGYPMTMTIAFDNTSWDFNAALPIDKEIKGNDQIKIQKSYSGKVIFLDYFGAYDKTTQAYNELHQYLIENKLEENGGPCEIYITDPTTEPDTSKWKTEIYFPVK